MCLACSGNLNWSPPNAETQGFMPPEPIDIRNSENIINSLKYESEMNMVNAEKKIGKYLSGKRNGGIAVIDISILPMAYKIDKYKIVRNFPNQLSHKMPPNMGKK